jgi:hypothetical protein
MSKSHSEKPADVPVLVVPWLFAIEGMGHRQLASVGDYNLVLKPDAAARRVIEEAKAGARENARRQIRELYEELRREGKPAEAKRLAETLAQTRAALQAVEEEQAEAERDWKVLVADGADADAVQAVEGRRRDLAAQAERLGPRLEAIEAAEAKARRAAVMEMRAALQQRLSAIRDEAGKLAEAYLAVAMPRLLPALVADNALVGLQVEQLVREVSL